MEDHGKGTFILLAERVKAGDKVIIGYWRMVKADPWAVEHVYTAIRFSQQRDRRLMRKC